LREGRGAKTNSIRPPPCFKYIFTTIGENLHSLLCELWLHWPIDIGWHERIRTTTTPACLPTSSSPTAETVFALGLPSVIRVSAGAAPPRPGRPPGIPIVPGPGCAC